MEEIDKEILFSQKAQEYFSKTIGQCAEEAGWCDKLVEEVANYYKRLILSTIPHLEKGLLMLEDFDAGVEYTERESLVRLIHALKSESYGAK